MRYEVGEMRRKINRSKNNDEFGKDDESQQYGQVEKNDEVPKTVNKAVPVEDRYARASHGDFAAEEHEWKQAHDEVMDLAVKKNPSLKEINAQANAREHVEWMQNHVSKQFKAQDRTEGYYEKRGEVPTEENLK